MSNIDSKNIICELSKLSSKEDNCNFHWLSVSNNNKVYYHIDAYNEYVSRYDKPGEIIPDPNGYYPNIEFIKTILNRYKSMSKLFDDIKLTDDFNTLTLEILAACIMCWKKAIVLSNELKQLSILINIDTMIINKLMYVDITTEFSHSILCRYYDGAWLIRNSSLSYHQKNFNIFTLSYKNNTIHNIRYVEICGVGIYDSKTHCISDDKLINYDKDEFLAAINYVQPRYACLMDLLIDAIDSNVILAEGMLTPQFIDMSCIAVNCKYLQTEYKKELYSKIINKTKMDIAGKEKIAKNIEVEIDELKKYLSKLEISYNTD